MAEPKFIPCAVCGLTFRNPGRGRKYCTRACYESTRALKPKSCTHCGKQYLKPLNHRQSKFCSNECFVEARRVEAHKCITCGCHFSPVKYRASDQRYVGATGRHNCSAECIREWKSRTKSAYMRANREKFSGSNSWNWVGACLRKNVSYRGPDWRSIAEKARCRDTHKCKHCGMTAEEHEAKWGKLLEVHHIIPFYEFTDHKKANRLSNLVTLCKRCHMAADRAIPQRQLLIDLGDEPKKKPKEGVHRGTNNPRATIDEDQVRLIRKMIAEGRRLADIAALTKTTRGVVAGISRGKNWRHVI